MTNKNEGINRREFLKLAGLSAVGAGIAGSALQGCKFFTSEREAAMSPRAGLDPTGEMTYRTSNKGDKVSLLGYGMMRLPTDDNDEIDQETVNRLVDHAIAHGVTYFDTAPPYMKGKSEDATGIALSRHPRNSYTIATKMSNYRYVQDGMGPKEVYDASVNMYHTSMKKLKTDYIDYYLLHTVGGGDGMPFLRKRFLDNGLLEFLFKEREAGRIRHLGFSFHGHVEVFDYMMKLHDEVHWDFAQIQMNYLDWKYAEKISTRVKNINAEYLYGELEKRHIQATIMEPLLGGRLSNVHDHVVERLKQRDPNASIASWAFRFVGSFPGVLSVLSGMTYMEHLQDNLRTFSPLKPLTDEEFEFLYKTADIMTQYPTIPCNNCKYCMPCSYGLDIPGIFVHYNKCVNEGRIANSINDENYRKARKEFLVGYDRSIPKLRQANHCTGCGKCSPKCPQGIDIPAQLRIIDEYVEKLKRDSL